MAPTTARRVTLTSLRPRRSWITWPSSNPLGKTLAHPAATEPHPQFVSLDMDLVHLPALHQWLVDVLGVRATPFEPGPDGVLMQAKGEHDGLDRAAVGEQGQHHRHQHHVVV